MRIANIRSSNINIAFGTGKSFLYSDFDGTYMPFEHKDICFFDAYKNNEEVRKLFKHCFLPFKDFLNRFGDKFNFAITTGRNRPEFNYFLDRLKSQGADLPKPDTLITCDGKDIFYKQDGQFPSGTVDLSKRSFLSKMLNWKPEILIPQIRDIILRTPTTDHRRVRIIETPINKSIEDYGEISLEYRLKYGLTLERNFASFNEGYDFSPYIVFSNNADLERTKSRLEALFRRENINASVSLCQRDWDIKQGGSYQSLSIKPRPKNGFWKDKKINKLIDTHKKVEDIYKNRTNDLVIVAGDAGNDEDMLNIFNYVDILGLQIPPKNKYEEFLSDPNNRALLKQLPFMAIVAGNKEDLKLIRQNQELLSKYGIESTVFVDYEKGEILLDGIKQAMHIFSQRNEIYKNALGEELLREIEPSSNFISAKCAKLISEIKALFGKIDKIKETIYA